MKAQLLSRCSAVAAALCTALLTACGGGGHDEEATAGTATMPVEQRGMTLTSRTLDVAIAGAGLLAFVDDSNRPVYSRSGRLDLDRDGYLVHAEGWRLAGRSDKAERPDVAQVLPPLSYTMPGRATTRVNLEMNLDSRQAASEPGYDIDVQDAQTYTSASALLLYDANGAGSVLTLYMRKVATDRWDIYASVPPHGSAWQIAAVEFQPDGRLRSFRSVPFDIPATTGGPDGPTQAIPGVVFGSVDITQFGSWFSVTKVDTDGYPPGKLAMVEWAPDGQIAARYDNGQTQPAGQALLARFILSDRLQRVGSTGLRCVSQCGAPIVAPPGHMMLGVLVGGALEEGY